MAYTKTPEQSTYSSERIPAAYGINLRPGAVSTANKDAGMINVIPFQNNKAGSKELWGETRYGLSGVSVVNSPGSVCRGTYVWEKTSSATYYFVVVNTSVYTSTNGLTWTAVDTLLTNATTPVRFTEFIDSTNVKKLVLVDGVEGYVYTTNAAGTKITDADFPTPHVPFPVFIDGYLFLAKAGTGDIYNSNLNDPALWTAGDFISSELYPDDIQAILKVNNYLLAIGNQGSEYFYDAANATGSPLARYEGGNLPFGTSFPNLIATNKDTVVLLANNNDGEGVFKVIEGFKYKDIPCQFVLNLLNTSVNATGPSVVRGYFFRQQGELFYAVCFNGALTTTSTSTTTPTFAYSFSTGLWFELVYGLSTMFPVFFTASSTSNRLLTSVAGSLNGQVFFGLFSNLFNTDTINGLATTTIYQEIRTEPFDAGTLNVKTMSRFGIGYSSNNTSASSPLISFQYTDNDWDSVSAGVITQGTNASGVGGFPFATQLGIFRQRSFKVYTNNLNRTRWKFFEMDINKGQQ